MVVTYRGCTEQDFYTLVPLFTKMIPMRRIRIKELRRAYKKGLTSGSYHYLCAETKGKIVGFCSLLVKSSLRMQGSVGHIEEIVVHDSFRRKGIGSELLKRITEASRLVGCTGIIMDVAPVTSDLHDFYVKNGFENKGMFFSREL